MHLASPKPGQFVILEGVSWEQYEALDRELEGLSVRLTFLDGTLEIMPPPISDEHESRSRHFAHLVAEFCLHTGIKFWSRGSKTHKKLKEAGVEPDEQFYFHEQGEIPDLAIEIALTSGGIEKLDVYQRFGIPEVWIWRENKLEVHQLAPSATNGYRKVTASQVLPGIDLKKLACCAKISESSEAISQFRKSLP